MFFFVLAIMLFAVFFTGCTQKRSVEVCESKPIDYGQRDECFRYLAKETNDSSYCEYINDSILRDYWCYRELAYCTNNSAICEKIKDIDAKNSCYAILSGKEKFEGGRRNPCNE